MTWNVVPLMERRLPAPYIGPETVDWQLDPTGVIPVPVTDTQYFGEAETPYFRDGTPCPRNRRSPFERIPLNGYARARR